MEKVIRCLDIVDLAQGEAALLAHRICKALREITENSLMKELKLVACNRLNSTAPGHMHGLLNFHVHTTRKHYHTYVAVYIDKLGGMFGLHILVEFNYQNENIFQQAFLGKVRKAKLVEIPENNYQILYKSFSLSKPINVREVAKSVLDVADIIICIGKKHYRTLIERHTAYTIARFNQYTLFERKFLWKQNI